MNFVSQEHFTIMRREIQGKERRNIFFLCCCRAIMTKTAITEAAAWQKDRGAPTIKD